MSTKLKVQQLRDELSKRGLDTTGLKPALVRCRGLREAVNVFYNRKSDVDTDGDGADDVIEGTHCIAKRAYGGGEVRSIWAINPGLVVLQKFERCSRSRELRPLAHQESLILKTYFSAKLNERADLGTSESALGNPVQLLPVEKWTMLHRLQFIQVCMQETAFQRDFAEWLQLPFALLSDASRDLQRALNLPTFKTGDVTYLKCLMLLVRDGLLVSALYPVVDPNGHAGDVLKVVMRPIPERDIRLPS